MAPKAMKGRTAMKAMKSNAMKVRTAMKAKSKSKRIAMKTPMKAKAFASRAGSSRKVAKPTKPLGRRHRSIVAALTEVPELPETVRGMLVSLVGTTLVDPSDCQHRYIEQAATIVGGALSDIERRLAEALQETTAAVAGADADKNARELALADAETVLSGLKQAIGDCKGEIRCAAQAVAQARRQFEDAKATLKHTQLELKGVAANQTTLEVAEKEAYHPLKEKSAGGQRGQTQLKTLRKVGKAFGFHEVMLGSLPAILRKQPDKRQTFDAIAMNHLETQLANCLGSLSTARAEKERDLEEQSCACNAASENLKRAEEQHCATVGRLAAAESALAAGRETLAAARHRVQAFPADAKKARREASSAETRLGAFRRGPMAAFDELRRAIPQKRALENGALAPMPAPSAETLGTPGIDEAACTVAVSAD